MLRENKLIMVGVLFLLVCISLPFVNSATFLTESVLSQSSVAMTNDTFVVGYCNNINKAISWQYFYTNGTSISNIINASISGVTTCNANEQVSLTKLTDTSFVVAWFDRTNSDATFRIFYVNGTPITNQVDADTNVGTIGNSVSVSSFNSTSFVMAWYDSVTTYIQFGIYNNTGGTIVSATNVKNATLYYSFSVSTFNSTSFVIGFFDNGELDSTFQVWNSSGSNTTGFIDSSTSVNAGRSVSVASISDSTLVIAWVSYDTPDLRIGTYYSNGTSISGTNTVNTLGATPTTKIHATKINNSMFGVSYYRNNDGSINFASYYVNGTALIKKNNISTTPNTIYTSIISSGLCTDTLLVTFTKNTTLANFSTFYVNGTVWDGNCGIIPPISNSCTWSGSGTWNINISDNCVLNTQTVSSPIRVYGGSGVLTINGTILAKNFSFEPSVFNGGFIIAILKGFSFSVYK